jgi:hypothetical protein
LLRYIQEISGKTTKTTVSATIVRILRLGVGFSCCSLILKIDTNLPDQRMGLVMC